MKTFILWMELCGLFLFFGDQPGPKAIGTIIDTRPGDFKYAAFPNGVEKFRVLSIKTDKGTFILSFPSPVRKGPSGEFLPPEITQKELTKDGQVAFDSLLQLKGKTVTVHGFSFLETFAVDKFLLLDQEPSVKVKNYMPLVRPSCAGSHGVRKRLIFRRH